MATIRITQCLRPNGILQKGYRRGSISKKAKIFADIPDELKGKADLLEISAEAVPCNMVMIYAHVKGQSAEDELTELADNGPGENSLNKALIRLINRF